MELLRANAVLLQASLIEKLIESASDAVIGGVNATIAGRYFGEQLLSDETAMLRALALKYLASRMWREIQVLADDGITTTIDGFTVTSEKQIAISLVNHHLKGTDYALEIESSLDFLYR